MSSSTLTVFGISRNTRFCRCLGMPEAAVVTVFLVNASHPERDNAEDWPPGRSGICSGADTSWMISNGHEESDTTLRAASPRIASIAVESRPSGSAPDA